MKPRTVCDKHVYIHNFRITYQLKSSSYIVVVSHSSVNCTYILHIRNGLKCLCLFNTTISECKNKGDLIFLIDSSRSVEEYEGTEPSDNWSRIKNFTGNLIQRLPVGTDKFRVGLLTYSNTVHSEQVIGLGGGQTRSSVLQKVSQLGYHPGNTNTSGALRFARKMLANAVPRRGVARYFVLITDGISNVERNQTILEAHHARVMDLVTIFVVGITQYVDMQELTSTASEPTEYHLFLSENFRNLPLIEDALLTRLCNDTSPPPIRKLYSSGKKTNLIRFQDMSVR